VRQHRLIAALLIGVLILLVLGVYRYGHRRLWGRGRDRLRFLFGLLWIVGSAVMAYALQAGLRGSFDMSSINHREGFIHFTVSLGIMLSVGALTLHLVLRRSLRALAWDLSILSVLGSILCLSQPLLFGWHLDFPVPPPPAFFFPYFAALFLSALNGVGILVCIVGWLSWLRAQRGKAAAAE
jgi:hypothetical protein